MKDAIPNHRPSVLFVFGAACLAHVTALSGGYVWLDHAHIEDGLALAEPGNFASLFQQGFAGTGFYRPLMALSLSLDAAISKTPLFFRVVTLLWHAAAAALTTLLARRFGCSRNAAILAGLIFGVHPATSLVADAIAFRSESMITVALLSLVLAHLSARPLLAAAALFLGALSKETALALSPLMILALEVGATRRGEERAPKERLRLLGAELAALLCAAALRFSFAPLWRASHVNLDPLAHVGTRLAAFARSSAALLVPFDSTICDATTVHSVASLSALVGAMAAAGAIYLASRERVPGLLFLLALVPALGLVPVMRFWSPHYLYLPLTFGAILAMRVLERSRPRWLPGAALVAAGLAIASLQQGRRFTSDEALWTAEVRERPSCLEGQFYLGEIAREKKDLAAAAKHYAAALAPSKDVLAYVDRSAALQNLGATSFRAGHLDAAKQAWTAALQENVDVEKRRELSINLAAVDLRLGRAAMTIDLLEPELRRPDPMPEAVYLTATALHKLGRESEAIAMLQRLRGTAGPMRDGAWKTSLPDGSPR